MDDQSGMPPAKLLNDDRNSFQIVFGSCGEFEFMSSGRVWIDWNKDGDFEESESVLTWEGMDTGMQEDFPVVIPEGTTTGLKTVARIMMDEVCFCGCVSLEYLWL